MTIEEFIEFTNKCADQDYVDNPNYHISAKEFIDIIQELFLGKDYAVVDSVSYEQSLAIMCNELIHKYLK